MKAIFSAIVMNKVAEMFTSFLSSLGTYIGTVIDKDDIEAVNKLLPNSWDIKKTIKTEEEFHFVKVLDDETKQAVAFLQLWRNGCINLPPAEQNLCFFYYQAVLNVLQSYFATLVTSEYRRIRMINFSVAKGYKLFVIISKDQEEKPKKEKEAPQIIINQYIQTDTDDGLNEDDDPVLELIEMVCSDCLEPDCELCGLGKMRKQFFGMCPNGSQVGNPTDVKEDKSMHPLVLAKDVEDRVRDVFGKGGTFHRQEKQWYAVDKNNEPFLCYGYQIPRSQQNDEIVYKFFPGLRRQ